MSDQEFQTSTQKVAVSRTAGRYAPKSAPRHPDLPAVLGLLAGDFQQPHEGERGIVASAIWRALQSCNPDELQNVSKFVQRLSHDIESRAQLARDKDFSLRGNLDLVPVLALCAQIHRVGFVDADGKQARSLLFLALVDLAIHCPELVPSSSFKQTAHGLRIQLERLAAAPKSAVATHHFRICTRSSVTTAATW